MNAKGGVYAFLKQSYFEMIMVVIALLSGGTFACYHLKFGQLPLEEIRQYFLLKNEEFALSEFGFVFIDYAKLIAIMIFLDIFGYLKYIGRIFIMGILFGYGYIMAALYASMCMEECLPFILVLAIQGGILTSYLMGLCRSMETTYIRENTNRLIADGLKGTAVCLCITVLNLISRMNILN